MATTHLSIKFGNPTEQNIPSPFTLQAEVTQDKIKNHYKKYSTLLSKYRLPLFVLDVPAWLQEVKFRPVENILEDKASQEKLIKGERCYLMYELKESEQIVLLKKFERMLQKLTALNNSVEARLVFFDLARKRKIIKEDNSKFLELILEDLFIDARVDLDGEFVRTLGELIGKVSPGFQMSPVVGFLELFQEAELELEFENPSVLREQTREQVFPDVLAFEEPGEEDPETKLVTRMLESEEKITMFIHFGKLGYLKLSGEARIWAAVFCLG